MTNWGFCIEYAVKWGFLITLPLLLVAFYANRRWRPLIKQWLVAGYSLVFVYLAIGFVNQLYLRLQVWQPLPQNTNGYYYFSTYGFSIYVYLFFILLTLILYLFKRIRHSFTWGILPLVAIHYETVYIAFTSLYMDSLQSSWRVYYHAPFGINMYVFGFIMFNLLALPVYFGRKHWLQKHATA